jgi:hypothetical protein
VRTFTAQLEPAPRGGHYVLVPPKVAEAEGLQHGARVRGTLNATGYRSSLMKYALLPRIAPMRRTAQPNPQLKPPAPGTLAVCERPESAQFDAVSNAWYVSCMAKPDIAGDGFIAKLNAAADSVVTEKFTTGLNEPKGIRIRAGKLYVSDVTEPASSSPRWAQG